MMVFHSIGCIRSCFTQKFGIPRQASLLPQIQSHIQLQPGMCEGLELTSHIWVLFHFHANKTSSLRKKVRPPRLGGNQKLGCLATRSPYRPNPIGLSLVRLVKIESLKGLDILTVEGGDFLDGTPVLDIKPYLAYADQANTAQNQWAPSGPTLLSRVTWLSEAEAQWKLLGTPSMKMAIEGALLLDPRPGKDWQAEATIYISRMFSLDFHWQVKDETVLLRDVRNVK
jgi:tRNA-Thr(GGU) m(6)t(6)A37 methyltransferase TsaA